MARRQVAGENVATGRPNEDDGAWRPLKQSKLHGAPKAFVARVACVTRYRESTAWTPRGGLVQVQLKRYFIAARILFVKSAALAVSPCLV